MFSFDWLRLFYVESVADLFLEVDLQGSVFVGGYGCFWVDFAW